MSRTHIPKALRERVAVQARHRCGYCLTAEMIVGTPMELDHILPEADGGLTEEDNLWLACSLCKNSGTSATQGIIVVKLNRTPLWKPTPGVVLICPVRSATRVTRSVVSIIPIFPSRVTKRKMPFASGTS